MAFKPSKDMTAEEAEDYMRVYHATVNVLANSVVLFDSLSRTRPDEGERNLFRSKALEANRALGLLSAKILPDVIGGQALVRRPSAAEIDHALSLTQKLADLAAAQAKAEAIVKIATDALKGFNKLNAAGVPPAAAPAPASAPASAPAG